MPLRVMRVWCFESVDQNVSKFVIKRLNDNDNALFFAQYAPTMRWFVERIVNLVDITKRCLAVATHFGAKCQSCELDIYRLSA
jgi:hypothetical protein